MSDFRPRRPRLKLNPNSYRKLRTEVLERDGWRCHNAAVPIVFSYTTCAREASWVTTQTKISSHSVLIATVKSIETASSHGERGIGTSTALLCRRRSRSESQSVVLRT